MSAIPLPDVDTPPDDDLQRRAIPLLPPPAPPQSARPIPLEQAPAIPMQHQPLPSMAVAKPARPILEDENEYPAYARDENPRAAPIQTGVASLWTKAENIHNPILRVLGEIGAGGARALDVAGTAAGRVVPAIGAAESAIPGTTFNTERNQRREAQQEAQQANLAEKQAGTEHTKAETEQAIPAAVAHTQAETGAIPSTIAHTEAETKALGEPKPEKSEGVQQIYADAIQDAISRGVDPNTDPKVKQLADTITSLQKPTNQQEKLDQQYQDALTSGDHEKAERILKVKSDLAKAGQPPQRPPQTMVVLPGGQTEVARPGMTLPEGTQNLGGFATMGRPTQQQRNVQAQAAIAAEGIPVVVSEIDKLKDQIGPVSGRWNEFMQGKVGMENPEMAGLRADLLMVSSAVALAHARGRLPENLREEFDKAINSPKQDPENLKAVLNHIQPWMQRMQNMSDVQTGKSGGELTPPKAPDTGMKWQHRAGTNGQVEWRQVAQ
jgi:hypothetical protein